MVVRSDRLLRRKRYGTYKIVVFSFGLGSSGGGSCCFGAVFAAFDFDGHLKFIVLAVGVGERWSREFFEVANGHLWAAK
jgi:hypothetical protein